MLKFENVAVVGDRIRSHDFFERTDCYVEGVVTEINKGNAGPWVYAIRVDVDAWPAEGAEGRETVFRTGKNSRVGRTVFVPMGVAFMEWDGRVVNLSRPSA